ncbi:MAG TPA: hypothetical protein VEN81_02695 [Planctomycetota bacterium]|jgi:hypothetical protein|nr:hypothetical protein [Planctomycetota bacterium]
MAENLECHERPGYLEVCFLGTYELSRYKGQMLGSVEVAREKKFTHILVNLLGLAGYDPSTNDRYEIGNYGGEISRDFRIAALLLPEQWGDRFITKVARNRGVDIAAFTDREEALAWLLEASPGPGAAAVTPG